MTSLVVAMPASLITSIETSGAFGAAPVWPCEAPAAMLATKVPCPRPSRGEFRASEVRVTCPITRPPKSGREVSMPESTIAIVGGGCVDLAAVGQNAATPATYGHSCLLEKPVAAATGALTSDAARVAP